MKGFSLIELMVVLAILFILFAITIPAISELLIGCDTLECSARSQDNNLP